MTEAIGIRLDDDLMIKIDSISKEEEEDRSTVIRKLISRGYKEIIKEKASDAYRAGRITLSEAAHRAGLTVWDMERYLVERGFKSQYSVEDLLIESATMAKDGREKSPKALYNGELPNWRERRERDQGTDIRRHQHR